MTDGPISRPKNLTVLVFKENLSARTFRIPFRWITGLGALLGIICCIAVFSSFFAVKYFLNSSHGPILDQVDQGQNGEGPIPHTDPMVSSPSLPLLGDEKDQSTKIAQIAKMEAEKDKAEGPQPPSADKPLVGLTNLFVPAVNGLQLDLPDPRHLPFQLNALKMEWVKTGQTKALNIRFILQYTKADAGSQQGRILIFARGSGFLISYPPTALHSASSSQMISPQEGEVFSVSRFREVKASFGTVPTSEVLSDLEILIFEKSGHKLLTYQRLPIPQEKS